MTLLPLQAEFPGICLPRLLFQEKSCESQGQLCSLAFVCLLSLGPSRDLKPLSELHPESTIVSPHLLTAASPVNIPCDLFPLILFVPLTLLILPFLIPCFVWFRCHFFCEASLITHSDFFPTSAGVL